MSDILNKVEKERSKIEQEKSNFKLNLQCEVQKARKTFKHKISKDQHGIENTIKDVNKLCDECNITICVEIETYVEQHRNIIDQQVKDHTIDLNTFKVAAIDQCVMIEDWIRELQAEQTKLESTITRANQATNSLKQVIDQSKKILPSPKADTTSIDREIKKQVATEILKINPKKFTINSIEIAVQLKIVLDALVEKFKKKCNRHIKPLTKGSNEKDESRNRCKNQTCRVVIVGENERYVWYVWGLQK